MKEYTNNEVANEIAEPQAVYSYTPEEVLLPAHFHHQSSWPVGGDGDHAFAHLPDGHLGKSRRVVRDPGSTCQHTRGPWDAQGTHTVGIDQPLVGLLSLSRTKWIVKSEELGVILEY